MDGAYADEKATTQHIDEIQRIEASIDPRAESRLVTKLECVPKLFRGMRGKCSSSPRCSIWIMPLVTLLFLLNFIDRSASV